MARKSRKSKRVERAESVQDSIPDTGSLPRPAVIFIIAIVLLLLGVTIGVVVDVVMQPTPQRPVEPQVSVKPRQATPPVMVNVPKPQSFFEDPALADKPSASERPFTPMELNAVQIDVPENEPVVAIVIDDMGLDRSRAGRISALPAPLTLSFLTYADDLASQTNAARNAGHEIMAHVPMEPVGNADPGPGALVSTASPADLKASLTDYLDGWSGYVGINNHMGSKLTANTAAMDVVMMELRDRGLLWLDSRTGATTVGEDVAAAFGVPHVGRDVFLDNEDDRSIIDTQLAKVEAIAKSQGYAVAIGHPRDNTIEALAAWLPTLQSKGVALAPITEVVRRASR